MFKRALLKSIGAVRSRNVFKGFKLYHKPLLVSYSRSGTNWLLHIISELTDTVAPNNLTTQGNFMVDRAHMGFSVIDCYDKSILLLRDYKECITRHHGYEKIQAVGVRTFLENDTGRQPAIWYVKNVCAFEKFKGEKIILYFEDMVRSQDVVLRSLEKFLNLDSKRVDQFIEQLKTNNERSLKKYEMMGHKSHTSGSVNKTDFHQNKYTHEELLEFDNYFKSKLGEELFHKYLRPYLSNIKSF